MEADPCKRVGAGIPEREGGRPPLILSPIHLGSQGHCPPQGGVPDASSHTEAGLGLLRLELRPSEADYLRQGKCIPSPSHP